MTKRHSTSWYLIALTVAALVTGLAWGLHDVSKGAPVGPHGVRGARR